MNTPVIHFPHKGMVFYRNVRGGSIKEDIIKNVSRYHGQVVVELESVEGFFGWRYWEGLQENLRNAFTLSEQVVD